MDSERTATERRAEAGQANLATYRASGGTRAALKHGIHALIKTHQMPPGAEQLAEEVNSAIAGMISDLGGSEAITAQQRAILEGQRLCLAVLLLANAYLREHGLLDRRGRPHPILSTIVSFVNSLRLNAVALGLERRARDAGTLETVLKEYETKGNDAEETTGA